MDRDVSTLHEHELRSVWAHEEQDFTRWLTEHIEWLGSALGIELEDPRSEEAVGDFSSDIVAREMNTGETVVIENQYGKTDHDHLGKLLTYPSGKKTPVFCTLHSVDLVKNDNNIGERERKILNGFQTRSKF